MTSILIERDHTSATNRLPNEETDNSKQLELLIDRFRSGMQVLIN